MLYTVREVLEIDEQILNNLRRCAQPVIVFGVTFDHCTLKWVARMCSNRVSLPGSCHQLKVEKSVSRLGSRLDLPKITGESF